MTFLFEKLDIYQKAIDFNSAINQACMRLPNGNYSLINQLKRASLSIAANIAEGSGRLYSKDKRIFYCISRGSIYECVAIIDICSRNQLLNDSEVTKLKNDLDDISRMMTKLIQSLNIHS